MDTHIAICISTYQRPRQLSLALRAIGALQFDRDSVPRISVIVVDNDPDEGATAVVRRARPGFRWTLTLLQERQRGIPQTRNRAVKAAMAAGAHYCAFIDDDEYPQADWLHHLLACSRRTGAALVQGKVVPEFVGSPPKWALAGTFFNGGRDERGLASGASLDHAATNNLLARVDLFARVGMFDEWWATQGGDDTEFSMRAARYGFKAIWCPEAVVHEWIPASRTKVGWVLQRGFRSGNTYGLIYMRLNRSRRARALIAASALLHCVRALTLFLAATVRGRVELLDQARGVTFACGAIAGIFGKKYLEYLKPQVETRLRNEA